MSLSYSGLTNYGKATNPSVEMGLGSMNILRDPPRSITTRRIDKVGQTSSLTEMIDESGNRACEAINVYARGVNPCVSVSYGNAGNNGGQRSNSIFGSSITGGLQAKLPYSIMKDGAFRPPVQTQDQLLPLSRLPRVNTESFTQPGFVDYSKKIECSSGDYRQIKKDTLKACIRPTATYKISPQAIEPFEIKYVIKNPVKFDSMAGFSGTRTRDLTMQDVKKPTRELHNNILNPDAYSNKSGKTMINSELGMNTDRYIQNVLYSDVQVNPSGQTMIDGEFDMNTDRYIQNVLHTDVQTNRSKSIHFTPIDDVINVNTHTKNINNISYTAPKTGNTKDVYIHEDIELQRSSLLTSADSNKTQNIYVRPEVQYQQELQRNRPITQIVANQGSNNMKSYTDLNSRDYKLNYTVKAGSFEGKAQMPLQNRITQYKQQYDTEKSVRDKKIMEMRQSRY
jgi:hypothetical protein